MRVLRICLDAMFADTTVRVCAVLNTAGFMRQLLVVAD